MRIPNGVHDSAAWRIHDIVPDFTLEDVWALPIHGDAADFPALLGLLPTFDLATSASLPTRLLWSVRDGLGRWLGLGRISVPIDTTETAARPLPIPGSDQASLADRLPADLRDTATNIQFRNVPFRSLYRTDVEFAAELSNRTVHAVMHLGWADQGDGDYQGQMAVYVKPRGRLGQTYLSLIKPIRLWIVYPELMRQVEKAWNTRVSHQPTAC